MPEVRFIFQNKEIIIKCKVKEKMKEICQAFSDTIKININNLFFKYDEKEVNEELTFNQIINSTDKKRKKINIYVEERKFQNNSKQFKEIICPICKESSRIKIEDYKFSFYNCKNGHKINNILFNEFENLQNNDLSGYICTLCYKKIFDINEIFYCLECGTNFCQNCKFNHKKTHRIIPYSKKNYTCKKHNDLYIKYCSKCEQNICRLCENDHEKYYINKFELLYLCENRAKEEIEHLRTLINELIDYIKDNLTNKHNDLIDYLEIYYKISRNFICNNQIRNYETFKNIIEFQNYNNILIKDIEKILKNDDNTIDKCNKYIMDMSSKIYIKVNEELYNDYTKKINYKFTKNPNLKYKMDISTENDVYGINDIFEVFYIYKYNNNQYIASPNYYSHNIDIYSLLIFS